MDIGCGGGISVKLNKRRIEKGTDEILNANVSALPFDNDSFDIITAFDTINFWPDNKKSISEIIRTLKTNGCLCINVYPKKRTEWHDFVKFKSDREYKESLIDNGLINVESVFEKNTIIIWGYK